MFSLHDPRDGMADQLITGMKLPHVAVLACEDHDEVICGPLNADQAAVLSTVGCMTNVAIDVIAPGSTAEFVNDLSDELGVPLGVKDGVIDTNEPDWEGMTAEKFSRLMQENFDLTPAEAELTALFASGGVSPEDFLCMTAGELTRLVGGNPVDLRKASDGFYQSAGVDADLDGVEPLSSDEYVDQLLRDQIVHGVSIERDGERIDPEQFIATAGTAQCFCGTTGCDWGGTPDNTGVIGVAGVTDGENCASGPALPERAEILTDAATVITAERQNQYGEPEDSLAAIGAYWGVYCGRDFTPKDVAIMMTLLKIARAENGYHRDNYVDAAGYIGLAGEAELNAVTTPNVNKRTVH
jgi:hypothetical protein